MIRRTAVQAGVATLLVVALAACDSSSGADRGSASTVATEPAPTTTTNPYAVPAVIDEVYVNRVLAGLDAAMGDVVRLVVSARTIPPEAYDRLKALYATPDSMQLVLDGFQLDMRRGFTGYKSPPGNKRSVVTQIVSARPTCTFVRVERDYSAVSSEMVPTADIQWIGLRPLDSSRDTKRYNPTPWSIFY